MGCNWTTTHVAPINTNPSANILACPAIHYHTPLALWNLTPVHVHYHDNHHPDHSTTLTFRPCTRPSLPAFQVVVQIMGGVFPLQGWDTPLDPSLPPPPPSPRPPPPRPQDAASPPPPSPSPSPKRSPSPPSPPSSPSPKIARPPPPGVDGEKGPFATLAGVSVEGPAAGLGAPVRSCRW